MVSNNNQRVLNERERELLEGAITSHDVEEIRARTRIGDKVTITTFKACGAGGMDNITGAKRTGVISRIMRDYAIVTFRNGVQDSITWVELIQSERRKKT